MAMIMGGGMAALALVIVVLGLRLSGAKSDASKADQARLVAISQLEGLAREYGSHQKRTEARMEALRKDIKELENDLETCTTPGARRERLRRLLSKAATGEDGGDTTSLRSVPTPNG